MPIPSAYSRQAPSPQRDKSKHQQLLLSLSSCPQRPSPSPCHPPLLPSPKAANPSSPVITPSPKALLPSPSAITPFALSGHSPAIHEQRVRAPTIICSLLAWQYIPLPMQEKRTARQNNCLPMQEKRTAWHDIRNSRFAMHKSAHATLISHLET